ncbi:MAG: serine hydrolase [Prolixibacteraceae bacterium]|nr:serine hydrolase [Prolixibacteraceae bacterium]NLO01425.1 beta-lactamase family protein [Bacteroidales bacterium]
MNRKITLITIISLLLSSFAFMQFFTSTASDIESRPEQETDNNEEREKDNYPEIEGIISEYDKAITEEIQNSGTVGSAIAIVYKDQIAFLKCFGVRRAGEDNPVDENTIFRLASVSKTITGVLAGMLTSENVIGLDDKVADYIPGFRLKSSECSRELTLRNILSHTSGLAPHAYDNLAEDKMPLNNIIKVLDRVNISSKPGKIYSYQNVMFSLIDPVIEAKTLKSYSELVREKVFIPFGMANASTDFQSFKNNNNKAFPHVMRNGCYTPVRLNDRYYCTAPAAGVNASISDMANFLLALLDTEKNESVSKIHQTVFTPQVVTGGKMRNWDNIDSRHYAIGWRIIGYQGREVAYHGGYVQGYRAEIALCRNEKAGIVYLSNSPHLVASKCIPAFLNLFFNYLDNNPNPVFTSIDETAAPQKLSQ